MKDIVYINYCKDRKIPFLLRRKVYPIIEKSLDYALYRMGYALKQLGKELKKGTKNEKI